MEGANCWDFFCKIVDKIFLDSPTKKDAGEEILEVVQTAGGIGLDGTCDICNRASEE